MIYSDKKKTRNGEPLYLIKFDTAEEANEVWKELDYLKEHGGLSDEGKECYQGVIDLLKKRCVHNEKYDSGNSVGTMMYSSEICHFMTDLLLSCTAFSSYIHNLEEINKLSKEVNELYKKNNDLETKCNEQKQSQLDFMLFCVSKAFKAEEAASAMFASMGKTLLATIEELSKEIKVDDIVTKIIAKAHCDINNWQKDEKSLREKYPEIYKTIDDYNSRYIEDDAI